MSANSNIPATPPLRANEVFVPAPGLAHPIAQTVWPMLGRRAPNVPIRRERWATGDGDFLDVDLVLPPVGRPQRGFVVLVHGLEGSSRSPYILGMLDLARERGLIGVAMNFRSCSGVSNLRPRVYHAGETNDLRLVVRRAAEYFPGIPGAVVGFSLGANMMLNWLSEEGRDLPAAIRGAVAVSCPFDLKRCAEHLDMGRNFWIRRHFLTTLRRKGIEMAARFPDLLREAEIRRARTFREFDGAFTARLHGFRDAEDYWHRTSSARFLRNIARPTLLISALDDPIIPPDALPRDAAALNSFLSLAVTERGGHVGFVAGSLRRPRYWAEERAIAFVDGLVKDAWAAVAPPLVVETPAVAPTAPAPQSSLV